ACEALAWPLYRETELLEQAGNVMVVVPDREPLRDQVTDHRARPHSALVSRGLGAGFDGRCQLRALRRGELRRGARRNHCDEPLDAERLVPLQPAIHRAARHACLRREVDDATALDVPEDSSTSPPAIQVPALLRRADESP